MRNLIRSGVGEKATMAVSGHKTRVMFDRHNIVGEEETAQAFRKLDRYLAATAGVPGGTASRHKGHKRGTAPAATATNVLTANV